MGTVRLRRLHSVVFTSVFMIFCKPSWLFDNSVQHEQREKSDLKNNIHLWFLSVHFIRALANVFSIFFANQIFHFFLPFSTYIYLRHWKNLTGRVFALVKIKWYNSTWNWKMCCICSYWFVTTDKYEPIKSADELVWKEGVFTNIKNIDNEFIQLALNQDKKKNCNPNHLGMSTKLSINHILFFQVAKLDRKESVITHTHRHTWAWNS